LLFTSYDDQGTSCPPAFFPLQRVSFSPKLRVTDKNGLRLEAEEQGADRIEGMMLGVTGVAEVLDPKTG
jgi:hypothetical protein